MMDGHHFENGYLYISAVKSSVYDEILYADVHCYAENGQPQKIKLLKNQNGCWSP